MKKTVCLIFSMLMLVCFASDAIALPPAPSYFEADGTGIKTKDGVTHVGIGDAISEEDTEKAVWELIDSNGDIVASMTVECSDLTDESQDCEIKYYIMIGGSLVVALTLDAAE